MQRLTLVGLLLLTGCDGVESQTQALPQWSAADIESFSEQAHAIAVGRVAETEDIQQRCQERLVFLRSQVVAAGYDYATGTTLSLTSPPIQSAVFRVSQRGRHCEISHSATNAHHLRRLHSRPGRQSRQGC